MADEESEATNYLTEVLCKVGLCIFGLGGLGFGFLLGLGFWLYGPEVILSNGGVVLANLLLEVGLFIWTLHTYLTRTEGGLRMLARLPPYRAGLARAR